MNDIEDHREHYANLVTAVGGVDPNNSRLISAFSTVKREDYLGSGPWKIRAGRDYIVTPTSNPTLLYQDVLVALKSENGINNGQPSLHARCLNALDVTESDAVIHVGSGTGYYTAILAELVGLSGKVYGYEIDTDLARLATKNLKSRKNVNIRACSGTTDLPLSDVIYVNAGVTEPATVWLDALKNDGRLLFPLTSTHDTGGMLFVHRIDESTYSAKFISSVGFIPCVGLRDEKSAFELADTFKQGGALEVKSLHRDQRPDDSCWFKWEDCWLSTQSV